MKTKAETEITLKEIYRTTKENGLAEARIILKEQIGASIETQGTILKVIKRNDELKLFISTGEFSLKVFAEIEDKNESFRKGSEVSIKGLLKSFGHESIVVGNSR